MSKMLDQARKETAAGRAPHQLQGGGLRKAGDANVDPAQMPDPAPAPAAVKKAAPAVRGAVRRPAKPPVEDDSVRKPFGSYLPRGLHRRFKAGCVLREVEIQDALEEAVEAWLDPAPVVRLPKSMARTLEEAAAAAGLDPADAVRQALQEWAAKQTG